MRKLVFKLLLISWQIYLLLCGVEGFIPSTTGSNYKVKLPESFPTRLMQQLDAGTAALDELSNDLHHQVQEDHHIQVKETLAKDVPTNGLLLAPAFDDISFQSQNTFSFQQYLQDTSPSFFTYQPTTKLQLFLTRWNLWKQFPWQKIDGKVILKVKIGGTLPLKSPPRSIFSVPNSEKEYEEITSLEDITNLFLFAAKDPRVKGILVEIGPLACGYGKLFEITRVMNYYKQSKKPLIAYSELNTEKEFYLACQCHQRFMPPEGILDLRGISSSISFYRDLFQKIGIEPQVQRLGKYKSFGDTYNRRNMSDPQREVITSLLLQSSSFWVKTMSEILKKNVSEIINLWKYPNDKEGGKIDITGQEEERRGVEGIRVRNVYDYEKLGLLTGVLYYDQVEKLIETAVLKDEIYAYDRSSNFLIQGLLNIIHKLITKYPFKAEKKVYHAENNSYTTEIITMNETYATDLLRFGFVSSRAELNQHADNFNLTEEFTKFPRRSLPIELSPVKSEQFAAPQESSSLSLSSTEKQDEFNSSDSTVIPTSQSVLISTENITNTTPATVPAVVQLREPWIKFPKWFSKKVNRIVIRNYLDAGQDLSNITSSKGPKLWEEVRFFSAQRYLRKMRRGYRILKGLPIVSTVLGPRIGIITAAGSINTGASSGNSIGSDSIIELLREAKEDDQIKAVILRIDSPGGSALASDLVWREIRSLARVKPVVASMVDVAASGGYYFAMACDQIVAEELTVTGSIGVVTAKLNTKELSEKLGVPLLSRGFTDDEATYFEESAKKAYKTFVEKAAASRSLNYTSLHEIAQGRVWTGRQAYDRGLVDQLGGLWKAIEVTQQILNATKPLCS